MTRDDAIHIVDVAFNIPLAVRRSGEDRTYHEAEIREAKRMAIKALEQINKIADIVDGTIDHFEYDDAMDMLYEIKEVTE